MFPLLASLASGPLLALLGFGTTRLARTALVDTLSGANVQVVGGTADWALTVDLTGGAALGLAAWSAALVVHLTGRLGDRGVTPRRLAVALGSAAAGQLVGLAGAVFHTARAAVPAALGHDVTAATPTLDVADLMLGGWAAGGAVAGVVLYATVTAATGLVAGRAT